MDHPLRTNRQPPLAMGHFKERPQIDDMVLKGSAKYDPGESIDAISRSYNIRNPLKMQPPLTPGEHLLLLSQYFEKEARTMELNRCLVLPDTPEIRAELQRGIAQNDRLRFPDRNAGDFIPY
jgi:hypothetical protein